MPFSETTIEAVARSICEARVWKGAWERANEPERNAWLADARAALCAIERSPEWVVIRDRLEQLEAHHCEAPRSRRIDELERICAESYRTLRDEFAAAALTGLISSEANDTPENFAAGAYKLADAMLKERGKPCQ